MPGGQRRVPVRSQPLLQLHDRPRRLRLRQAGAKCKTNSENSNCYSKDLREYSVDGCWTCNNAPCISGSKIVTTCCDCRTSAARCNDRDLGGGYGRCIAHSKTTVSCG